MVANVFFNIFATPRTSRDAHWGMMVVVRFCVYVEVPGTARQGKDGQDVHNEKWFFPENF